MEVNIGKWLKKAKYAFSGNKDPTNSRPVIPIGSVISSTKPDRVVFRRGREKEVIDAVINKIAVDASMMNYAHIELNEKGQFKNYVMSTLNRCLQISPNLDQYPLQFKQDVFMSLLEEGDVAVYPTRTDNIREDAENPYDKDEFDVIEMRCGRIVDWYPSQVKINIYDEETCELKDLIVNKSECMILENPFYAIMNRRNGLAGSIVNKLAQLDAINEHNASGKLDLIMQMPYSVRTDTQKDQAAKRKKDITDQLKDGYGIAWVDATEKITQLNRPIENNLLKEVQYLSEVLYSQLGISQSVLDGTATSDVMANYYARTVKPLAVAFAEEMRRKFLSWKQISLGHESIMFFRDPFELLSGNAFAELTDKLSRNAIESANELRSVIGLPPDNNPKSDMLINNNLNHEPEELGIMPETEEPIEY